LSARRWKRKRPDHFCRALEAKEQALRLHWEQQRERQTKARVGRRFSPVIAAVMILSAMIVGGCDVKSFIDPSEMGRYKTTPLQKPILSSLSSIDRSIDDPNEEFVNATDVQPKDLVVVAKDYVIGKNDLVNVSVTDLVGPGVETTKVTRVSESGNVSLPLIGQVKAEGLTEAQLEQAIVDAYRNASLIQNAQVSVTVQEARARTFSAYGAVTTPGQYAIVQSDFRLLDALVLVRDALPSVDTVYVVRDISQDPDTKEVKSAEPGPTPTIPTSQPGDNLAPQSSVYPTETSSRVKLMQTAGTMDLTPTSGPAVENNTAVTPGSTPIAPAGGNNTMGTPGTTPNTTLGNGHSTWTKSGPVPFQFVAAKGPQETRVIRVPLNPLRNGELGKYNIVVRPRDLIIAPQPVTGEYYMGGHVARTGVYSLTGRQITLKQAVIAAGMLDGAAIPQRTDLIRRIGEDREVFARINLDAIFAGTQPDIYLKPNDQLMVGTNFLAPFIAAIRGGFRISYGFGFLYDRNFAPAQQNP
jgi:polysaccharide biosynthesis/export protein